MSSGDIAKLKQKTAIISKTSDDRAKQSESRNSGEPSATYMGYL